MFVLKRWLIIVLVATFVASCSSSDPDLTTESDTVLAAANFEISVDTPCEVEAGKSLPLSVDSTAGQALPAGATVTWQATTGSFSRDEGTLTNYTAADVTEDTTVRIQATLSADSGSVPLSVECLIKVVESEEDAIIPPTPEPVTGESVDGDSEDEGTTGELEELPSEEVGTELPPELTVEELIASGEIIIAVHNGFEPFSYIDADGNYVGFEIDIANELVKRWFDGTGRVVFEYVGGDEKFAILERNEADLTIAAVTRTVERCVRVNCTINYFEDGARILVHPDSGITSICDLDGMEVSGRVNTTAISNIESEMPRWCQYTIPPRARAYSEHIEGIEAVKTGVVEAYTTDGTALESFARQNPPLVVVGGAFSSEPYSALTAKQNIEIRDLIDATLQEMKLDGTYDTIYARWFGCEEASFPVIADKVYPEHLLALARSDAPVTTDACAPPPTEYRVASGDTLGGIARTLLGSFDFWTCIHDANREQIGDDPSRMRTDIVLQIPDVSQCGS